MFFFFLGILILLNFSVLASVCIICFGYIHLDLNSKTVVRMDA